MRLQHSLHFCRILIAALAELVQQLRADAQDAARGEGQLGCLGWEGRAGRQAWRLAGILGTKPEPDGQDIGAPLPSHSMP